MAAPFLTFEGLDGSGKSTHLRRLAAWLESRGESVCVTQEPGGTDLGEALRSLFLDRRYRTDGRIEALLVFASRRHHLLERIEPALAEGRAVLCDRFTDSTLVYQGVGRGVPAELLLSLDEVATGTRRPDRTLLFDVPPETARRRVGSEERARSGEGVTRFDAEELPFYQRVRKGYLRLVEAEPERFRVIDSSGPREATFSRVLASVADLFPDVRFPQSGAAGGDAPGEAG